MSKRTICCKMIPTPIMSDALAETCRVFAEACNATLVLALKENEANNIRLHHLAYRMVRNQFSLSANLAVRAIRRVSGAMVAARKRKRKPHMFRPTSIDYDARVFAYRPTDETVSLTVMDGRIHIPLLLGAFQRQGLVGQTPTAATVVRKGRDWYIHIVVTDPDKPSRGGLPFGIDMGIRNTAATSIGTLHDGQSRRKFKEDRARIRASLQSKGTRGAKTILRRLSGYEERRIRHENHVLSKRLVDEAIKAHCGTIRMELLKNIRERTRIRIRNRHMNRMMSGWSFGQLQSFVEYKAKREGLTVEYVNPAYTSQTCPHCGLRGVRKQDLFVCSTCGRMHADLSAALNIAGGGVVDRPELTGHSLVS